MKTASATQVFTAVSIAPPARAWLETTRRARILHVFDRACNLINEDGKILSLVTPEVGEGPFSILVDIKDSVFTNLVTAETPVSITENGLELDRVIIHTHTADIWNPRPRWENLHGHLDVVAEMLPLLQSYMQTHAPPESLAALLNDPPPITQPSFSSRFLETARRHAQTLCMGIANGDLEACRAGARGLAGLGGGLTPAGDDYLLGAIFASWIVNDMPSIAAAIAETAAPLTTPLSAAWLRAAARGEASAPWHSLVESLDTEDQKTLLQSARRILASGHTSGADALAGFVAALSHHPTPSQSLGVNS